MSPEELCELHHAAFDYPRPWTALEFASILDQPTVFLVSIGKGFLIARVLADETELLTLAVPIAERRRGIGKTLVQEFLAEASHRGAETAFLEVAADNGPARALYGATGWDTAGMRSGYYRKRDGTLVDALIMRRGVP
ncbi:MAG: GNAT family N-acetyltransferase [Pseudomonadota bacterium]